MKNETFCELLGEINENYVKEAETIKKAKKPVWLKWGATAACLCLVVASVIGAAVTQHNKPYTAVLSNGDQMIFQKGDNRISDLDIAIVGIRKLSETEANEIFGGIHVDATVGFDENTGDFISLEGSTDHFDIMVLRSDISPDIVIEGDESISDVHGVPVSAGYFLTKANSKGNKTAIVYASFEVGNYTVYIETSGTEQERDTLCNTCAREIEHLLETASLDFERIKD